MKTKLPLIIVNFKAYDNAIGEKAEKLAIICQEVAEENDVTIMIAVQPSDIFRVSKKVSIPVLSEHIDPIEPGAHTGYILAKDIKENGAVGTLLNHSEHRMRIDEIEKAIDIAKKYNLITVVCASNDEIAEASAVFNPDFIAVEPPELIGTNVSVSKARPELIRNSINKVKAIKDIPVLCGAGIKTKEDVKRAIELGAKGILVASAVTLSKNPKKILDEFCKGMKEAKP